MPTPKEIQIVIKGGQIRFIHSDDVAQAFQHLGTMKIARASHVEPDGNQWCADMSPVGGPKLGPFARRDQALKAEVKWLQKHHTPAPL